MVIIMNNKEIQLALNEFRDLTGFKTSRSDFSYEFNVYLNNKDIGAGDAVKICETIINEIKRNPLFDIEKRLYELCDECYVKQNPSLCYNCHKELLKHANYCTHCGSEIPEKIKKHIKGV